MNTFLGGQILALRSKVDNIFHSKQDNEFKFGDTTTSFDDRVKNAIFLTCLWHNLKLEFLVSRNPRSHCESSNQSLHSAL